MNEVKEGNKIRIIHMKYFCGNTRITPRSFRERQQALYDGCVGTVTNVYGKKYFKVSLLNNEGAVDIVSIDSKDKIEFVDDLYDNVFKPRFRYSVYGEDKDCNSHHRSFPTYQKALDFYTVLRDKGFYDLRMTDNKLRETLADNDL